VRSRSLATRTVGLSLMVLLLASGGEAQTADSPPGPPSVSAVRDEPDRPRRSIVRGLWTLRRRSPAFETAARFGLHGGTGTMTTTYENTADLGGHVGYGLGGRVRVWKALGIGVSRMLTTSGYAADAVLEVPDRRQPEILRPASATATGLKRVDQEIALEIAHVVREKNIETALFIGPVWHRVRQQSIVGVRLEDRGAVFLLEGLETRTERRQSIGMVSGLNIGWSLARFVGLDVDVRYTRGPAAGAKPGTTDPVRAGGFRVGTGVRLQF
jgi:hypothetical protein